MTIDAQARVSLLETMILARRQRQALGALSAPALTDDAAIGGDTAGDEAAGAGAAFALALHDRLVVHHRRAPALLARGAEVADLIAETLLPGSGYIGDAPGALHRWAAAAGVLLTSTLDGSELTLAPRAALAQRSERPAAGAVTAVLFDASAATAPLLDAVRAAAVQGGLPLLLLAVTRGGPSPAGADASADGSDVEAVYAATRDALRKLRAGAHGRLLHLPLRPGTDPVAVQTQRLLHDGVTSAGELGALHQRVQVQVAAALASATAQAPTVRRPVVAANA